MSGDLKYKDITEKIIGASFEVHKFLGNGFQEVIYQRALAYEMRKAGLEFAREIEQDIFYKELEEPIGTHRNPKSRFCSGGKSSRRIKSNYSIRRCALGTGSQLPESLQTESRAAY
jgi:hypothetical protein